MKRTTRKRRPARSLTSHAVKRRKVTKPKTKAAAKISLKRQSRAQSTSSRRRLLGLHSEKANEFAEEASGILSVYQSRTLDGAKDTRSCPYDTPVNRFKRDAYHFIRTTLARRGWHKVIKSIVRRVEHEHKGPDFRENPFFWGLLAMDWERTILDRRVLGHFARQMVYAERHGVPPCLLVGFLYQIGKSPKELASAVAENRREPWLRAHEFLVIEGEPALKRPAKTLVVDRDST